MRIAYFQFDGVNPYQRRFFESIQRLGVDVRPLRYRAYRPLAQVKHGELLHLDWLHPFYKGSNNFKSRIKRMQLEADLRLLRCSKLVWTVHNILSHDSYLSERFERNCLRRMISSVDAVMGFSEAVLESLFSEFPEAQAKRRFVIPHGNYCQDYPPPLPKSQARLELGLPEDAFVILFFGGLRSNKGVVELIQSFEKLENSKNSLVIAGGGETPDVSAALDRASANPRIKLYRRVIPDAEVPTFFGAADVVAFPFRSILNSGSVILALSMARCVVVPGVPSLVEQIPDFACFQFPPCDSGGLVSALGEALATPDLSDRGQQARAQMLNDRDWNTIGEKAVQMYQQLLA